MTLKQFLHTEYGKAIYPLFKTWFTGIKYDIQQTMNENVKQLTKDKAIAYINNEEFAIDDMLLCGSYAILVKEDEEADEEYVVPRFEVIQLGISQIQHISALKEVIKFIKTNFDQDVLLFKTGYHKRTKRHEFGKPVTQEYLEYKFRYRYRDMVETSMYIKIVRFVYNFIKSNNISNQTSWSEHVDILKEFVKHIFISFVPKYCATQATIQEFNISEDELENSYWYFTANAVLKYADGKVDKYNSIGIMLRDNKVQDEPFKAYVYMLFKAFDIIKNLGINATIENKFIVCNFISNLKVSRALYQKVYNVCIIESNYDAGKFIIFEGTSEHRPVVFSNKFFRTSHTL